MPSSEESIEALREAARDCRACDLWERATQTVFGEVRSGHHKPKVMLVGEQPGNDEDLSGKPFVGPAGQLLDRALVQAGIDRAQVYVTNTVKHFKWEPRGKRRIHVKPNALEVAACRTWLDREIAVTQPALLICLGATAAQALLGSGFRVTQLRGQPIESPLAPHVVATVHPSSILRADPADREREFALFVTDLKKAAALL